MLGLKAFFLAVVVFVVAVPTLVSAGGPPLSETVVEQHFVKTIQLTDNPPCIGTVTYDVRSTLHITDFGNGTLELTENQSGDVTFISSLNGQAYSGNFAGTFGFRESPDTQRFVGTATYSLIVRSQDGSELRFSNTVHVTFTPGNEQPAVEFDRVRCSVR